MKRLWNALLPARTDHRAVFSEFAVRLLGAIAEQRFARHGNGAAGETGRPRFRMVR
ncbi:hypothetical protein NYQ83_05760 [Afifella sp. JA880]|uniref:hypothetical protein n=1 Tax=Afifella sp. JA880 TaxID=2975280 RepID=UPI0021BAD6F1|nr:hypothetical protein [Afifella sp. JA880]MCT8266774.1 hypothetical protein [Afifella sp. JA880]